MSGMRDRTALEATGARLGDLLRRALTDRLARRRDGLPMDAAARQGRSDLGLTGPRLQSGTGGAGPAGARPAGEFGERT